MTETRLARLGGSSVSRAGVRLAIDLDKLGFGLVVEAPGVGLHELVSSLPAGAQPLLAWLPDIVVNRAGLSFVPTKANGGPAKSSGEVGVYVNAGLANSADSSAELLIAVVPAKVGLTALVGLNLSSPIDLGGTPLFGSVLSGISLTKIGIAYASNTIPASQSLPPPIPTLHPTFQKGVLLTLTVASGDAEETFVLSPSKLRPKPLFADALGLDAQSISAALVELLTAEPASLPIEWFAVQKTFGPLTIGRVGIITGGDRFGLALDAGLNTSILKIDLRGFSLTFPPNNISLGSLRIDLDGLGVEVAAGSLQISGALVKVRVDNAYDEYQGALSIQAGPYGIAAVGAYAVVNGAPSMFVFGMASGPFGGPPAFYVTGLALGFGYNRALKLPTPDQVLQFPLVLAALNGSKYLPDAGPRAALKKLSEGGWVPPSEGNYWVAAGVRFRSFQLIDAFVLLSVQFGRDLVIALLGVASLQLPQKGVGPTYAYVEMTLHAVLHPREGVFQLTALLTPSSFVIDRACRLTGGFAFSLWFGANEHAGDFVVTLGGYHPNYRPEKWYPTVPRLGIDWRMSSQLQLRGGLYFALTPSCVMAGGDLALTFHSGDIRAWFTAYANFLMAWRPFFYDVGIGVNIGASYTFTIFGIHKTVSVELSASVRLWGPPLVGVAHVNWWIISFTININGGGSPPRLTPTLPDWKAFEDAFLPSKTNPPPPLAEVESVAALPDGVEAAVDLLETTTICRPRAASGLLETLKDEAGNPIWIVSSAAFSLLTETVIPATEAIVLGPRPTRETGFPVGVYPLGSLSATSKHTVGLYQLDAPPPAGPARDLSEWSWKRVDSKLPASLWDTRNTGLPQVGSKLIPALVGWTGVPNQLVPVGPPAFDLGGVLFVNLPARRLVLPAAPIDGSTPTPIVDPLKAIQDTVAKDDIVDARSKVASVLNAWGIGRGLDGGKLSLLKEELPYIFPEAPMLGPLGSTGPRHVKATAVTPVRLASPPPRVTEAPARLTLRAAFRQRARAVAPAETTYPWQDPPLTSGTCHVQDARADRHDEAVLASMVTATASDAEPATSARLQPGTTLLWGLDPSSQRALHADGQLPLRVAAFDAQYELVDEVVLGDGAPGAYDLPETAVQAALTCLRPAVTPDVVGWYGTSTLLQVGAQALLGEGVVVRPQSPQQLGQVGRTREVGTTTAAAMVGRNWTEGAEGLESLEGARGSVPGWIATTFSTAVQTLVVMLRRDDAEEHDDATLAAVPQDAEDGAEVSVWLDGEPGAVTEVTPISALHTLTERDLTYLFFAVPAPAASSARLHVLVQAVPGWLQDGLLGFAAEPDEVLAGRAGRRPLLASASTADTRAQATSVTFQ